MKNDTPLFVLCATDQNYVPYCGIMITSLFENNLDLDICVYILTDTQLTKSSQRRFETLSSQYHQHIEIIKVDRSRFEAYPTRNMSYWSIAMYYRILAPEILPESVDRVLYLDCDIIISGSLKQLLNIEMDNYAVGAVIDICHEDKEDTCIRLKYPCNWTYFNSGVLLINLNYWRKNCIQKQCLDYLTTNYSVLSANDQDVLNAVLYDKTIILPIYYNYQVLFKKKELFNQYDSSMQSAIIDNKLPIVIHYALQIKPWNIQYYKLPFAKEWSLYKRRSLWWYIPPVIPKQNWLKYVIKRLILWPLGIMINWPGREFIH